MQMLRSLAVVAPFALTALLLQAAAPAPLRAHCSIGPSEEPGQFSIRIFEDQNDIDCEHRCNSNFNHDPFSRLTGITRADLARDGASLTAIMTAEAGTFKCSGTVHEGVLSGESVFTPDQAFIDRMEQMGFTGYTSEKLEAYAFLDVRSDWARSLQQAGVKGIDLDNLIALRIFNVDPPYIASMKAVGYPVLEADKLIALRVQRVDPEEVRQIRAMGYQPSLDDLIQIRIFHITPDFIRKMQDRGFKDLTLSKLVQIKIFKLDE
jgi:hypothetical protein